MKSCLPLALALCLLLAPPLVSAGTADWKAWKSWRTPMIDVQVDKNREPLKAESGHAVVLMGYDLNIKAFLMRNSWGAWRGNAGHHWISFDYIRTYGKGGYYITAVGKK